MNDFTKEELQYLFSSVLDVVSTSHFPGLAGKIQFMIDNYCDHQWQESGDHGILCCTKCDFHIVKDD
jgi:hypothetical protein